MSCHVIKFLFLEQKYILSSQLKTWADAREECINRGRHLMEVRTQEEFDKAVQLVAQTENGMFWIGGSDLQQEGVWVWDSNRERMDMDEFWNDNEPNNHDHGEDCLQMSGHHYEDVHVFGFNDIRCSAHLPYVCVLY